MFLNLLSIICYLVSLNSGISISRAVLTKSYYYRNSKYEYVKKNNSILGKSKVLISSPGMIPLFLIQYPKTEPVYSPEINLIQNVFSTHKQEGKLVVSNEIRNIENFNYLTSRVNSLGFGSRYTVTEGDVAEEVAGASSSTSLEVSKVKFKKQKDEKEDTVEAEALLQLKSFEYRYDIIIKKFSSDYTYAKFHKDKTDTKIGLTPSRPIISINTSIDHSKTKIETKAFQIDTIGNSEYWFCIAYIKLPNLNFSIDQYLISLIKTFSVRIKMGLIRNIFNVSTDKIVDKDKVTEGSFEEFEYIPIGYAKITTDFGIMLNNALEGGKSIEQGKKSKKTKYNNFKGLISESIVDIDGNTIKLSTIIKRKDMKDSLNEKPATVYLNKKATVITVIKKTGEVVEVLFTITLDRELENIFGKSKTGWFNTFKSK